MNILMLSGSPKQKNSASIFFINLLKLFLVGHNVTSLSLNNKNNHKEILTTLKNMDVLIISAPLYFDGMPSNVLEFMIKAEKFCNENKCKFKLYVISNNGFIEGIQNKSHLKMYECWCMKSGIVWGGGVGIGGGVMLKVLSIVFPIVIAIFFTILLVNIICGNAITAEVLKPIWENVAIYLFFNCGVIYSLARLSSNIKNLKSMSNLYTRAMIPSFIFIPFASLFMILSSFFKGKFIFSLLGKDDTQ